MIRFALALVVGGAILTFFGYNEHKLASSAQADPQAMTVAELIEKGPGENAHIVLSDFWLLDAQSVVEYEGEDDTQYTKIWSPVITSDDAYVEQYIAFMESEDELTAPAYNESIHIVLYSEEINDDGDFYNLLQADTVQGLIINEIDSMGGEELSLLQQSLPGINPDKVLIFEHNRKPKSTGTTMLMMVGGVVLILAGPGLFFLGRGKASDA